ncbi:hypothetical protein [Propionivibrio sp.]|uniref:hypothetical protein n=1 Tax=Propionivibrio sp. TaxID=2212460 RepID=UPI003BF0ADF4
MCSNVLDGIVCFTFIDLFIECALPCRRHRLATSLVISDRIEVKHPCPACSGQVSRRAKLQLIKIIPDAGP